MRFTLLKTVAGQTVLWAVIVTLFSIGSAIVKKDTRPNQSQERQRLEGTRQGVRIYAENVPTEGDHSSREQYVASRDQSEQNINTNELVWLARAIHSETNQATAKRLVGWVARNRVESNFRGNTYEDVVRYSKQYSAFNNYPRGTKGYKRKQYLLSLDMDDRETNPDWKESLKIARAVMTAPERERPFSVAVKHHLTPRLLDTLPKWARVPSCRPIETPVDPQHITFFKGTCSAAI